MLIDVAKLKQIYSYKGFSNFSNELLKERLEIIEVAIRKYTNNNFQDRENQRVLTSQDGVLLHNADMFIKVGDTLQISKPSANKGLYVIEELTASTITLDGELYDIQNNLVTKIVYPKDIIAGAIEMLDYDLNKRDKTGIASESISRHSVSYVQYNEGNSIEGYPSIMFGFCKKYKKAKT